MQGVMHFASIPAPQEPLGRYCASTSDGVVLAVLGEGQLDSSDRPRLNVIMI